MCARALDILVVFLGAALRRYKDRIWDLHPRKIYCVLHSPDLDGSWSHEKGEYEKVWKKFLDDSLVKSYFDRQALVIEKADWLEDLNKAYKGLFKLILNIYSNESLPFLPNILVDITGAPMAVRMVAASVAGLFPTVTVEYVPLKGRKEFSYEKYKTEIEGEGGIPVQIPVQRFLPKSKELEVLNKIKEIAEKEQKEWIPKDSIRKALVQVDKRDKDLRKSAISITQIINSLVGKGILEKRFITTRNFEVRLAELGELLSTIEEEDSRKLSSIWKSLRSK